MLTGPLFKWFGSKWNASKHYPAPRHDRVFEPYAGSASYSLRHADRGVTIWDSDPNLQRLWPWLINASEASIREIPLGLPEGHDIRTIGLSEGQCLLLKHWQRTNNVGDCWTVSPWGSLPGQWTANTRARVSEEVGAIRHWFFGPPPIVSGTWFIDPPYQYNYQYRKGSTWIDYPTLVRGIAAIPDPSQIIVCEAVCPKTGAIPNWLPFVPFRDTVTSRRKADQSHHSRELIWTK